MKVIIDILQSMAIAIGITGMFFPLVSHGCSDWHPEFNWMLWGFLMGVLIVLGVTI